MTTYALTATAQLKSANTVTDVANHSGKENRKKYTHANKEIDQTRTDLNVEFDFHSREELLEKHYRERIDKHNKTNNSKARRYDTMDAFLDSFEGKPVRGNKNNVRWSTLSQITYVGDKDSLGELWTDLREAGVPAEELFEAYSEGYKEYVERHNETFPTLPIYRSDIHFDETTPHGHDAIVVMGHTKGGKASDSLNNALGEKYGYEKDNKEKMRLYREENDTLAFTSVTSALQAVGRAYGYEFDVELERTGQEFSLDMHTYKLFMDEVNAKQAEFDELEAELSGREAKLEERISEVEEKSSALAQQEADVTGREARLKAKEDELAEREERVRKTEREQRQMIVNAKWSAVNDMHRYAKGSLKEPTLEGYKQLTPGVMYELERVPAERKGLDGVVRKATVSEKIHTAKVRNSERIKASEARKQSATQSHTDATDAMER